MFPPTGSAATTGMLVPAPTTRFLIGSQPDARDILVKIRVSVENTSDPVLHIVDQWKLQFPNRIATGGV